MLQDMRTAVSSFWIKVLLFALVLSFISFYGFRGSRGLSRGTVATVDGTSVREEDLVNRYYNLVERYRQRGLLQRDIPEGLGKMIQQQALDQLINELLMERPARQAGLRVSPEEVKKLIRSSFSNEKGEFDFDIYQKTVRNRMRKTLGEFEKDVARTMLNAEFNQLLLETVFVPTEELRHLYQNRNDRVSLAFVRFDEKSPPRSYPKPAPPTQGELEQHLAANAAKFEIPEARKLEVSWYEWTDFVKPSPEELETILQKKFPSEKDAAATGERVRAAHILLRTREGNDVAVRKRAEEIYARLKKGDDFSVTARRESEDSSQMQGGDLGYFGRGAMVKEFEAVTFSLRPGEISPPFRSQFGYHIVKLLDRIPAGPRTVARLKPELVGEWEKETLRNPDRLEPFLKETEKLFDGTTTGTKDARLRVVRTGFLTASDPVPGLSSETNEVHRIAKTLAVGAASAPFSVPPGGRKLVVRVEEIRPARATQLAEIRSAVEADFRKHRAETALTNFSKQLLARWASSGKPIGLLAREEGLRIEETGEFSRSNDNQVPKIGMSPAIMAEAFSRTEKQPFLTEPVRVGGVTFLLALQKRTPPDWARFETEKESLRDVTEEDAARQRAQSWTSFLRSQAKIRTAQATDGEPASPEPPIDF